MTTEAADTSCVHGRSHISDSRFHGHGYSTADTRRVFCDACRLQRWLDVEAALALSQADVGLLSGSTAERIARAADIERMDADELVQGFHQTSHSLVALLRAHEQACENGAGEYVHFGATTQDVQDTAQALEMRDVLDVLDRDLPTLLTRLRDLAVTHRRTLMVGRTHARPALPTTFGLRVAGWLDELLRHAERLGEVRGRVLVAQLFGGVGTMAGFGAYGPRLLERFAERLGLAVPRMAWHVARDRVAEFVTVLAMLAGTLARIADELRTLGRPEFGELEEDWQRGRVGSSTMPHKRNPEACEQVVVLARLARASAGVGLESLVEEHDRDARGLRLEWPAIAEVSHYTLRALEIVLEVLAGLKVHVEPMARHAHDSAESICTEPLMLALSHHLGKQRAYALVYELSQRAYDDKASLRTRALEHPDVRACLTAEQLRDIFDPAQQLGEAPALVDQVVADADRAIATGDAVSRSAGQRER
jgi:adenylosuccinate lyase